MTSCRYNLKDVNTQSSKKSSPLWWWSAPTMISECVPTASCMLERKLHTSPCTLRLSYRKSASSSKHWVKATIIRSLAPSLPEAIPCLSDVRSAPLVAFCFRWRYRSGSKSTISSMACPKNDFGNESGSTHVWQISSVATLRSATGFVSRPGSATASSVLPKPIK